MNWKFHGPKITQFKAIVAVSHSFGSRTLTKTPFGHFRLDPDIRPLSYELKVIPRLEESIFYGTFGIVLRSTKSISAITLHSVQLSLSKRDLKLHWQPNEMIELEITDLVWDTQEQTMTISFDGSLAGDLSNETLILSGNYTGILTNDGYGFYQDSFQRAMDGTVSKMAVTQLEPHFARRMFPAFDEPSFKAQFQISVAAPPEWLVQGNVAIRASGQRVHEFPGLVWTEFQTTEVMAPYTVALSVSELDCQNCSNDIQDTPIVRVCARHEQLSLGRGEYACSIPDKALIRLVEEFAIDPLLEKIDLIAPPSKGGAMENWGLNTFGENLLLIDPLSSSDKDRRLALQVVSHELTHQWFGNLITLGFWDEVWLNEGFTSYYSYVGMDAIEPESDHLHFIQTNEVHGAMEYDAWSNGHALKTEITRIDQYEALFDSLSYQKGAAIVRMMIHWISAPTFQRAIHQFLSDTLFGASSSMALLPILDQVAKEDGSLSVHDDFQEFMRSWLEQPSFPVLYVSESKSRPGEILLEQFKMSQPNENANFTICCTQGENANFTIPVTWRTVLDEGGSRSFVMRCAKLTFQVNDLSDNDILLFNPNQTGYYRVNYELENWNKIQLVLMDRPDQISAPTRVQLLNDAFSLAHFEHLDFEVPLHLARYIATDHHHLPWSVLTKELQKVGSYLKLTEVYEKFLQFVSELTRSKYLEIGLADNQEDFTHRFLRKDIIQLSSLCNLEELRIDLEPLMSRWMASLTPDEVDSNPFNQNSRYEIYCALVGQDSVDFWGFLYQRYITAIGNPERESGDILAALGCSNSEAQLEWFLDQLLIANNSITQRFDAYKVLHSVGNNPKGREIVWTWMDLNWNFLKEGTLGPVDLLVSVAAQALGYSSFQLSDQLILDQFLLDHGSDILIASGSIRKAKLQIQSNALWHQTHYDQFEAFFS
ncbi:LOW QUALITY PROTEIN: aminopeptidase N-like [Tigriopus californicus]|uniref:LOW QUALITY PROTEIN: aminopeptidase N-like n=1 Tax=Tigriopus californicus TaxID=6832 RepID=UPI0027DA7BD0|nr:LOW QUALITY PROTEIN: aminopeptidase N-like [Tigriopus californicus]